MRKSPVSEGTPDLPDPSASHARHCALPVARSRVRPHIRSGPLISSCSRDTLPRRRLPGQTCSPQARPPTSRALRWVRRMAGRPAEQAREHVTARGCAAIRAGSMPTPHTAQVRASCACRSSVARFSNFSDAFWSFTTAFSRGWKSMSIRRKALPISQKKGMKGAVIIHPIIFIIGSGIGSTSIRHTSQYPRFTLNDDPHPRHRAVVVIGPSARPHTAAPTMRDAMHGRAPPNKRSGTSGCAGWPRCGRDGSARANRPRRFPHLGGLHP